MSDISNIPTFTQVAPALKRTPVLTSVPPVKLCRHNSVENICAFCSKFNYHSVIDWSGSVSSVQSLQKSISVGNGFVNQPLLK